MDDSLSKEALGLAPGPGEDEGRREGSSLASDAASDGFKGPLGGIPVPINEIVYHVATTSDPTAGAVQFVDKGVRRVLGYEPEEFLRDPGLWFQIVHPDDRETLHAATRRILKSREAGVREYRIRHKVIGGYRWMEDHCVPLMSCDGEVVGFQGLARDVTERKEAERQLRASEARLNHLLASTSAVTFSCGTADPYPCTFISPNVATIFGYQPEAFTKDPTFWIDRLFPEDAPRAFAAIAAVFETGHHVLEPRLFHQDGRCRWVRVELRLVRDAGGQPQEIVGSVIDITERKEAEETLRENERLLRESAGRLQILSRSVIDVQEAERRHIARELHDEIGQALTAVKINLHALSSSGCAGSLRPRLEESAAIVDGTLQRVRDLSLDLRPALLDDLGLPAALRWYLDRQAQRVGFSARFVSDIRRQRLLPAVETACFRIAQEALTNVARHARASHVRVELRRLPDGLLLLVRDDGTGFDVAAARDRATAGKSLGLFGMEERAALLGGAFTVESVPGEGTLVRAFLPSRGGRRKRQPPC